ncbi:MAG: hypothetical protein JWM24_1461, partial [Solirubrobacterales bacterium]|nr:hypothetical protein [Solirubrobacterales bacterium]
MPKIYSKPGGLMDGYYAWMIVATAFVL